ncbi:hypothetical protein OERS_38620 [Oerskovia enterophila]|uniref:Secreted protein n=1 Tax=Oerskovia enterophila TaxID=43678 RepID=A0ABX2XZB9_9CELL|nr:hypothetical protein OERS_38620 [Oerskovia enterophila]
MNQVWWLLFAVPDLPALGRESWDFLAVPCVMTFSRANVTVFAIRGSTAFGVQFAEGTGRSVPSAPTTRVIAIGAQYVPPLANVA